MGAFNLADEEGVGRYECAGVGLAGSRGGALITNLGIDEIGCECKTSLCKTVRYQYIRTSIFCARAYPASIWIQKSP